MAETSIKEIILKVNGEDAQEQLNKINAKLEDTKKKRKELTEAAKGRKMTTEEEASLFRLDKQIKQCNRDLGKMAAGADEVTRTLHNLEQANPKQLQRTLKSLKSSLSGAHMQRGSKEWQIINDKIKLVKAELEKVNAEQREAMSMSDRFAEWGQKWMGIAEVVETSAEAFSGVKMKAAEAVESYLNMDEAQVAVKKYTGLNEFAIYELNQVFKKMDTRTPREKLNALAADAGRLGITTKDAIIDFVTAANMINVALGEDLGEDAVKNIGKLAQLFGDDEKLGLKSAMISTGSVINDLAQTSSANEGYIMDFTARLAGMAKQANMSQAQVMALASVMDQAMVNSEEGSTALMKVIQQIYREPEKMATAAGLEVSKFTELVKTDANEALLQFAAAVSKMGGMDKIAPMLGDLSLTGAGVSKAIATLANNVDKVRAAQAQATEAFRTGSSVINEYNTANNSATAQVEKNRKKIEDLRIELGEKLQPIMAAGLSSSELTLRILIEVAKFIDEHKATVISIAASLLAWQVQTHLLTIKTQALYAVQVSWSALLAPMRLGVAGLAKAYAFMTASTHAATIAQKQYNLAVKSNPVGLIIGGIITLITFLAEYRLAADKATKSQKELNEAQSVTQDVEDKMMDSISEKIAKVKLLEAVILDNNRSLKDRQLAINELKQIIPSYNGLLADEKTLTENTTTAIDIYVGKLKEVARAKAVADKMMDIEKKKIPQQSAVDKSSDEVFNIRNMISQFDKENGQILAKVSQFKTLTKDQYNDAIARMVKGNENVSKYYKQGLPIYRQSEEWHKAFDTELERVEGLSSKRRKLVKALEEAEALELKQRGELDKLDAQTKELDEYIKKHNIQLGDIVSDSNDDTANDFSNTPLSDDKKKEAINKMKAEMEQKKLMKRLEYENGLINQQDYSQSLLQIDIEYYKKEQQLHTQYSAEWTAAENKILDARKALRQSNTDFSLHQIEIENAESRRLLLENYAAGEMDEKAYQDRLTQIQIDALKRRAVYLLANAPGSEEQQKAQEDYQNALAEDQFNKKKSFLERAAEFERKYSKKSNEEKKAEEIKTLDELIKAGVIAAEDREKYIKEIEEHYRKDKESPLSAPTDPISNSVIDLGYAISNLQQKLRDGQVTWQDYAAVAVASLGMISTLANSASQLIQTNIDVETAKITRRYDAEIAAAGKSSRRARKLEEKKQQEIAKVKNKYANKAMVMQLAGAVAQTAVSAINAYSSAAAVPLIGHIIAPIAASAAIAAGMMQIATIKRQQQAQSGYYHGGFTGGRNFTHEAGVVHEGEFVANHQAVSNPHILPFLEMLDYAQRNNKVASLTDTDVSRSVAAPQQTAAVLSVNHSPVVVQESEKTTKALDKLNTIMDKGIPAYVVIDGPQGLKKQMDKYNRLVNR